MARAKRSDQDSGLVRVLGIKDMSTALQHSESRISTRNRSGTVETISLQEMIARDARQFLLEYPTISNRFAFYRRMEKLDPEILLSKNYLALMIQRSYLGPRLDTSDKSYVETPDFLSNVNIVLSEMQFASRIGTIAKDLIRYGNAFLRVRRYGIVSEDGEESSSNEIASSEIIPPDSITILSDRYIEDFENFKGTLNARDYYVIAEKEQRGDKSYVVKWDSDADPEPDDDGKPPEIVLPARDMLQVAWDREGNQYHDRLGRETYNVWGETVYESIIVYVKGKLLVLTDYIRWMRQGMPRWVMSVAMDDILRLSQYEGSTKAKTQRAMEAAKEVFDSFQSQLYYYDDNEDSPTYRMKMPIEPDAIMTTSDKCNIEQKGGAAGPDAAALNMIKECNRAIASAMGVPLTLFGYQEGNTYATSKITAKFMAGYGGGLLRTIETDVKEFLKSEFVLRGLQATPMDWENLYFEYDRDDTEEMTARNQVDLTKAQVVTQLASAASALYQGGICSLNEARKIMKDGIEALKELANRQDGDELKPLQPMITTGMFAPPMVHQTHSVERPIHAVIDDKDGGGSTGAGTLEANEPMLEKQVKTAISETYALFIEDFADKVERGEIKAKGGSE